MKKILLIATGGTIASSETESGLAPSFTGEQLVQAVPGVDELAELDVVQPLNIDSTNMRPDDWLRIAAVIEDTYALYEGFVVLMGTDTLAYTAAALSYLVQQDAKPIVVTGAQLPMEHPYTDAKRNVHDAVLTACDGRIGNVSVVFDGKVIAGTRARKCRTVNSDAFASMNFPVLARMRRDELVLTSELFGAVVRRVEQPPRFFHELEERVMVLKLTPGMNAGVIEALRPCCEALVVEALGIGGVPEYGGFADALLDWADSGRFLVMTTQVPHEGCEMGVYEVGHAFSDHPNILQGGDMTVEALVAKAMWALGQAEDGDEVRELFYRDVNFDRS